jgi:hypothetical protein
VLDAKSMARYGHVIEARLVSVSMPNGGVRWLLVCPCCQTRATRLYGQRVARRVSYGCRSCWGLAYQSQYAGRRLEAHPDYLQAALRRQIERTPRDVGATPTAPERRHAAMRTHARRMRRYEQASNLQHVRKVRHLERRELAFQLAMLILLARSEAEERRRWRKLLQRILWTRRPIHEPTLRCLFTMNDTPAWARGLLAEALKEAQQRAKHGGQTTVHDRREARKALTVALETASEGPLASIIEQARLEALRARYAALGQGRRRCAAA